MTEFEKALQECLLDLEQGSSTLERCLSRHPRYARQLKPVLLTHKALQAARALRPSPAFRARVRARLTRQMQLYPRRGEKFYLGFQRPAAHLAAIVLALLIAGTAHAQTALPGHAFYQWKLASERVWRAASLDPVGADLALAERRVEELIAIGNDPVLSRRTMDAYMEVTGRLKSGLGTESEARIRLVLDAQIEELNSSGIVLQAPDQDILALPDELTPPSPTPPSVPSAGEELGIDSTPPVQETPPKIPTELPQTMPPVETPTFEIPADGVPSLLP